MNKVVLSFMPGTFLLLAFIGFRIHHAIEPAVPNAATGQSRIELSPPAALVSSRIEPIPNPAPQAPADHVGVFQPLTVAGGVAMLSMQPSKPTDSLITVLTNGVEVARITGEGRVYLNGKEVHTDREYRKVMMALSKGMNGCNP